MVESAYSIQGIYKHLTHGVFCDRSYPLIHTIFHSGIEDRDVDHAKDRAARDSHAAVKWVRDVATKIIIFIVWSTT